MIVMDFIIPALAFGSVWLLYKERILITLGLRSYSWKATTGTIVDSRDESFVTDGLTGSAGTGIGEVRWNEQTYIFEYKVADRLYRCSRYCFGGWAEQLAATYSIGDTVTVYFDPANPHQAVLKRGLTWSATFGIWPLIVSLGYALWRLKACFA
jgi:hypothetical protein